MTITTLNKILSKNPFKTEKSGFTPRYEKGIKHKRGKGTEKQGVLVAVERHGLVHSALIQSDQAVEMHPLVESLVQKDSQLMTDQNPVYQQIGKEYAAHSWVNHSAKEFARGDTHNNTAESFSSIVERTKQGVFHYMSKKHLLRYLNEIGFRWDHRVPVEKVTKKGRKKIKMIAIPVIDLLQSLLSRAWGRQLRRSKKGGIFCPISCPAGQ